MLFTNRTACAAPLQRKRKGASPPAHSEGLDANRRKRLRGPIRAARLRLVRVVSDQPQSPIVGPNELLAQS